MMLAAGTKLGPYEIQSPLGAGGWERCIGGGMAELCAIGLLKNGLGITLARRS